MRVSGVSGNLHEGRPCVSPFLFGLKTMIKNFAAWLMLVTMSLLIAACAPRATPTASPTQTAAPVVATVGMRGTPGPSAPVATQPGTATATRVITATPKVAATAKPTSSPTVAAVVDDEEECRKACHRIDINSLFGVGAKHQPANHKAYTTCLECHAPLAKAALPATHLGRQDAACPLCHLIK